MTNPHIQAVNSLTLKAAFISMGVMQDNAPDSDIQDTYYRYMQANHPDVTPNMPYDLHLLPLGKLRDAVIEVLESDAGKDSQEDIAQLGDESGFTKTAAPVIASGAAATVISFDTQTNPAAESAAEAAAIEALHESQTPAADQENEDETVNEGTEQSGGEVLGQADSEDPAESPTEESQEETAVEEVETDSESEETVESQGSDVEANDEQVEESDESLEEDADLDEEDEEDEEEEEL